MDDTFSDNPEDFDNLEHIFNQAADALQSKGGSTNIPEKTLLELYGLYKVSTVGPCQEKQPSIFNVKGRAKWTAWTQASTINKEEAMIKYIELVKATLPWSPSEESSETMSSKEKAGLGTAVSTMAAPLGDSDVEDEEAEPAFTWVKDSEFDKLRVWVEEVKLENRNISDIVDKNGLTLLHWAADRGLLPVCKLLLEAGIDATKLDNDGVSPLEYAETCEYQDIVELLQQATS